MKKIKSKTNKKTKETFEQDFEILEMYYRHGMNNLGIAWKYNQLKRLIDTTETHSKK